MNYTDEDAFWNAQIEADAEAARLEEEAHAQMIEDMAIEAAAEDGL